jgi:uncharacterized lipoprotein NlpE involved in copper resistance
MVKNKLVLLLLSFMIIAGCGQGQDNGAEDNQVKDITGFVMNVTEGTLLVTEKVDQEEKAHPNAAVYTVTEDTEVVTTDGENLDMTGITTGTLVEVWNDGKVAESFPTQSTAVKVLVHTDAESSEQAKAIHAALKSLNQGMMMWVKSVSKQDNGYEVHFSDLSGETAPIIVKVNEDFQVIE